jgi:TrmH family RNA methyltransferase
MPVRIVQSPQNERLKELRRALAAPPRPGSGQPIGPFCLIGIEGPNLLAEALRAGLRIDCVFAAQGSEPVLHSLALPPQTEILLLPRRLLDQALTTESPQPIAALVEPPAWSWSALLGGSSPLLLLLAGLQDPGNLGAILRSAEAFGVSGVVSLPGTVSPWNPKAVRASAGSVFRVPLLAASVEDCFPRLHSAGIRIFAATARDGQSAPLANLAGPTALLLGNEGNGLPPELAAQAHAALTIPCPGPVESLNAAVATAILLYEASRQRLAPPPTQKSPARAATRIKKSRSAR